MDLRARNRFQYLKPLMVWAFALTIVADFAPLTFAQSTGLGPEAMLGRALFFDPTLSTPAGMACASCHDPSAGFTFPESEVNLKYGPVPGIVPGRFGNRRPPTIGYTKFIAQGIPTYDPDLTAFMGGLFWDGRAPSLAGQIPFPLQNPNEMNNLVHNVGSPALVVSKVANGPYARQFMQVFGSHVFSQTTADVFDLICECIADYEQSPEVSPFSSKYDAFQAGLVRLAPSELNGLRLVTGSMTGRPGGPPSPRFALCVLCHGIPSNRASGPDLWTNTCYANIGVPKNPNNPYYTQTNAASNPLGYNAAGANYVDLGLGGFLYPHMGLPPGNIGQHSNATLGDFLAINGTFKAPTLRNVDKRPSEAFVKAYMHNGFFKSLAQVVHFYNTRSLTTVPGESIDFTKSNPYASLHGKPLWPEPEFPSAITLQNASGLRGSPAAQVGNLQLTAQEESDIVSFLETLSDGYFNPPPQR